MLWLVVQSEPTLCRVGTWLGQGCRRWPAGALLTELCARDVPVTRL